MDPYRHIDMISEISRLNREIDKIKKDVGFAKKVNLFNNNKYLFMTLIVVFICSIAGGLFFSIGNGISVLIGLGYSMIPICIGSIFFIFASFVVDEA